MTRRQIHGLASLALLAAAVLVGFVAIYAASTVAAFAYLIISAISAMIVIACFCAKCPHRGTSCAHFVPGRIAARFPARKQGAYTTLDLLGTVVALAIIVLIPQYWLIARPLLFIAFWALFLIGLYDIRACVCPECGNTGCPLARRC